MIPRYPVYSFLLPVYSFWCMDDFSWGNTRLVVGEGSNKKVIMNDDEKFDDSMIPMKKFSGTRNLNLLSLFPYSSLYFQSTKLKLGRLVLVIRMKLVTVVARLSRVPGLEYQVLVLLHHIVSNRHRRPAITTVTPT